MTGEPIIIIIIIIIITIIIEIMIIIEIIIITIIIEIMIIIEIIIIMIIIIIITVQRPRTKNTENVADENRSDPCGRWCAWYSKEGMVETSRS